MNLAEHFAETMSLAELEAKLPSYTQESPERAAVAAAIQIKRDEQQHVTTAQFETVREISSNTLRWTKWATTAAIVGALAAVIGAILAVVALLH